MCFSLRGQRRGTASADHGARKEKEKCFEAVVGANTAVPCTMAVHVATACSASGFLRMQVIKRSWAAKLQTCEWTMREGAQQTIFRGALNES